jgi:asparagine synthase (glutamine-hydrolysing)
LSGIAGIYCFDGSPPEPAALEQMMESMAHRGLDGRAAWSRGPVGLCHLKLCTTPESLQEHLPMTDATQKLVVTADARIDNRDELIKELAIAETHQLVTDGELILAAYNKWGKDCPEKLVGDFAFAIWDERNRTLFCARDHFGVKPFYYYRSEGIFAFASEIRALLRLKAIPGRINEIRVADFLGRTELDSTSTFYQDLLQLPAAHGMLVSHQRSAMRRYWALDASRELRLKSDAEYDEAFREHFTRAVTDHARSAYPVGSLLSGGLDSSSIVAVAKKSVLENSGSPLYTFSGVFNHLTQCDERPFINAMVAQGGLNPQYVISDRIDPWADIDEALREQQEPFPGPFLFVRRAFCHLARDLKVRVLLDGSMGDAVLPQGLGHLTELIQRGRWWRFATQLLTLKKTVYRNFDVPLRSLFWERAIRPLVPAPVRTAWRGLHNLARPGANRVWASIINPELASRVHLAERLHDLRADSARPPRTAREEHERFLASGLYHTFGTTGRAAAAFGLSSTHPFADRRLAEFCLSLPAEQLLGQGLGRLVLRRAMHELPEMVRMRRDKSNLQPLVMSMLFGSSRRPFIERVIFEETDVMEEYVDLDALRAAYRRCAGWEQRGGYASSAEVRDALHVWRAVILSLWLRARRSPERWQ